MAQHLILLLQQLHPPPKPPILRCFLRFHAVLVAAINSGKPQPLRQRHCMNPEIIRDRLERHPRIALASDTNNIVTELLGIRLGHVNILPAGHLDQPR